LIEIRNGDMFFNQVDICLNLNLLLHYVLNKIVLYFSYRFLTMLYLLYLVKHILPALLSTEE